MDVDAELEARIGHPLAPEYGTDQGDPYLVVVPPGVPARHRYYVIVTSPDAGGLLTYGSDDLVTWASLGNCLGTPQHGECWAPCIRYVPGLQRPWVMLYSHALGWGEPARNQGHVLRRADSERPEGPYVDSGELLTEDLDFAIDPEVYRRPDGSLWVAFATDYVDDAPLGTGLAEALVDSELRRLTGPVRPIARATSDWQVFDPHRSMPWKSIPGVDWARGDRVRWSCIEGPAAFASPEGEQFLLYSGGNFEGIYALGLLRRDGASWTDLSVDPQHCLLSDDPERGLYAPGHASVASLPDGRQYLCFHFRPLPGAPRQFGILPLEWHGSVPRCAASPMVRTPV